MNVLHKLAWAAVVVSSGVRTTEVPHPQPPAPAPESPRPAQPIPVSHEVQPASAWPLDLDDDEFEGEGWTFWPTWGDHTPR